MGVNKWVHKLIFVNPLVDLMERVFGYARVSTVDQNLDTQIDELQRFGCHQLFQEKITGMATSRPQLDALLAILRPGDTVVVARFTRLGRSSAHLLTLMADFKERGVRFKALDADFDSSTLMGKFALSVLALVSELDRAGIVERTMLGRQLAKSKGTHMGRPKGVDMVQLEKVKTAKAAGLSVAETVRLTSISESSVKRYRKLLVAR